jgi:hypothetical protein
MTVTTDALIPALEDTREAHAAVIDRFRSDMAATPAGPHRQTLERHIADAQEHIARIDDHLRDLRPRRLLQDTAATAVNLVEDALRTVRVPLEIAAVIAAGILRGERQTDERRLLKNTEDEYTLTATALAACRAGEGIAALAMDEEAEELLASLRRQDEQLLQALEYSVDERARALAAATADGGRTRADGGMTGAATRAVRTAVDRLREAALVSGQQTARTATGAARQAPNARRMAEQVQGAVTREEDLPIPGFGRFTISDITTRLRTLSQSDLTVIEGYERAHANRAGVLNAIEGLRGNQPWPAYDTMTPEQIKARLRTAEPLLAREVLDYEQRHQERPAVTTAARQRTGAGI